MSIRLLKACSIKLIVPKLHKEYIKQSGTN